MHNHLFAIFIFLFWLTGCNHSSDNRNSATADDNRKATQEATANPDRAQVILFFGNSLTAGYGLEQDKAFPALIQDKIDSLGLSYTVVNAGVSGETTSGGADRIDWVLERYQPAIFVLELGGNDGLRGLSLDETQKNLQAIIDKVEATSPDTKILLTGMMVPPNLGIDYTRRFQEIYPLLAKENDLYFMPFLLKDVGGVPELNLEDGIHPTAKGHRIIANNLWEYLKPLINPS